MTFGRLKSNLWKLFVYNLTQRRSFFAILSIYFLTLPNTVAQQIGIYSALGNLASFIFEIPSGYFADRFGHKRTLILSKILMILSVTAFVFANGLPFFILGSVFLSLGFAFQSGTFRAFIFETLSALKKEKDYVRIVGKLQGQCALFSIALIIIYPIFASFNMRLPFIIALVIDILALLVTFSLVSPGTTKKILASDTKSVWHLLKLNLGTGFYPLSIFLGIITGVGISIGPFRDPYMLSLGVPLIWIGAVMGGSRLLWYILSFHMYKLEKKITMRSLILFEIFFFPSIFILVTQSKNYYLVGLLFVISIGYTWSRNEIYDHYLLKTYLKDKKYKATFFSIRSQITLIFAGVFAYTFGYFMGISYVLGFLFAGIGMFVSLLAIYPFLKESQIKTIIK